MLTSQQQPSLVHNLASNDSYVSAHGTRPSENRFCWSKVDHRGRATVPTLPLIFPLLFWKLNVAWKLYVLCLSVFECEMCPVYYPWSWMCTLLAMTHDSVCLTFSHLVIQQQTPMVMTDPSILSSRIILFFIWNREAVVLRNKELPLSMLSQPRSSFSTMYYFLYICRNSEWFRKMCISPFSLTLLWLFFLWRSSFTHHQLDEPFFQLNAKPTIRLGSLWLQH